MDHLQNMFRPDSLGGVTQPPKGGPSMLAPTPSPQGTQVLQVEQVKFDKSPSSTNTPIAPPSKGDSLTTGMTKGNTPTPSPNGESLTTTRQPTTPEPPPTSTPSAPAPEPATPAAPYVPSAPTYYAPSTSSSSPGVVAPHGAVTVAPVAKYMGCVSRFHKTRRTFSVYCPVGWMAPAGTSAQLGFGFGAAAVPAPPPNSIKVADEIVEPAEAPSNGAVEDDAKPFYKNWKFWAIVAGSVAVVGTTSYVIYRRRRMS